MRRFSIKNSFLAGAFVGLLLFVLNTFLWAIFPFLQTFLQRVYAPVMGPFDALWKAMVNAGIFTEEDALGILVFMVAYFILLFGLLGILVGYFRHAMNKKKS
jgi:hypothetical protein